MAIATVITRKPRPLSRIRRQRRHSRLDEQSQESGLPSTTSELHKIITDSKNPASSSARLIETIKSGAGKESKKQTTETVSADSAPPVEADAATKDLKYPGYLMRPGSTGDGVRAAQMLLNASGNDLVTDGIFGPLTLKAVVQFQQAHNLLVDGIIGPHTWAALAIGGTTTDKPPDDYSDYGSELQELYGRLLDEKTEPAEFNLIIDKIFAGFPAPPQSASKNAFAANDVAQVWDGKDVAGLTTLLTRIDYYLALYNTGLTVGGITVPILGITELNLLLRSLQDGKAHPNLPKEYLPILPLALASNEQRKSLIAMVIFLNGAEGYRRLVTGMIHMKQQNREQPQDLAARMAFVHRAMSHIGRVESKAASGETARATIGKEGYTSNPQNAGKPQTIDEYPLRQGHELFDRIWMEAVAEKYYAANDRWGPGAQNGDHLKLQKPPKLPSWCGIYVTWIALQESLISSKWEVGGGNVEYKHWANPYDVSPWTISHFGIDPGDILYAMNNFQHECIAISYNPQTGLITSIDGNTGPAGSATGGQILVQERPYTFFSHVRPFKGIPKPGQKK